MTKISGHCGTGSVGFLEASVSNSEQMLPLVKVAAEPQTLRDLEGRNDAALDALSGLPGRLGCSPIFSAGLVEVRSEAIPFGQNGLQEGLEPFRAGHRFLQLREKEAGVHIS